MSRSGYNDCGCDSAEEQWHHIMWRGAVKSAIKGKRGQSFLRRALAALDALPKKELAANTFEADGQFCLLGAVANHEGVDISVLNERYDPEYGDYGEAAEWLAKELDIAPSMGREIVWENDCVDGDDNRFWQMRRWIIRNLKGDL